MEYNNPTATEVNRQPPTSVLQPRFAGLRCWLQQRRQLGKLHPDFSGGNLQHLSARGARHRRVGRQRQLVAGDRRTDYDQPDHHEAGDIFCLVHRRLAELHLGAVKSSSGNLVQITNNGAIKTLRVTTDNGNYNANFYILIPAYTPPASTTLTVSYGTGNGNLSIFFPTQPGYNYQLEFKTNLTDAVWIPLGNTTIGDGTTQSAKDGIGNARRFYRVRIQ
jgi:hypothetical protein